MQGNSHSIFADKDIAFEDILHGGKLGGRTAVVSYLDVRIKQMTREVESIAVGGLDRARILLSIRAMTEARKVALTLRPG
jgi:hypothetical protein